jgi:hypothetical protein
LNRWKNNSCQSLHVHGLMMLGSLKCMSWATSAQA